MKEYIEREAVIEKLQAHKDLFVKAWGTFCKMPERDKARVDAITTCISDVMNAPAADVVEVVPDLKDTVRLLHRAYEQAKRAHHVRDPLAYAVYQVWRTLDGRRRHGNPD